MFRVKICGITTLDDAALVLESGADAIGLNFYSQSSRYVPREQARAISLLTEGKLLRIGLFVNPVLDELRQTTAMVPLDLLQFHGDEPPEFLADVVRHFPQLPIIRAFRCGPAGLAPCLAYLKRCQAMGAMPRLVLLDAFRPGQYGGTGATGDWAAAAEYTQLRQQSPDLYLPPLILAGGLTSENVAQAIAAVGPAGVDTASGVESEPGRKDRNRLHDFVLAARQAFTAGEQSDGLPRP